MESLFETLKVKLIYPHRYATWAHARLDIVRWMEGFSTAQRLHSSIGYQAPIDAGSGLTAA